MPNHAISTSASIPPVAASIDKVSTSLTKKHGSILSELPEAKRRKFIAVAGIRVKVDLRSIEVAEMPDSYRRNNSVYPRSYASTEMPESPRTMGPRRIRFVEDDVEDGAQGQGEGLGVAEMGRGVMQVGTVTVPVPLAEDKEVMLKIPGLGRRAQQKENDLNDLGYRMLWSQTRLFSNKLLFLQKSRESLPPRVLPRPLSANGAEDP